MNKLQRGDNALRAATAAPAPASAGYVGGGSVDAAADAVLAALRAAALRDVDAAVLAALRAAAVSFSRDDAGTLMINNHTVNPFRTRSPIDNGARREYLRDYANVGYTKGTLMSPIPNSGLYHFVHSQDYQKRAREVRIINGSGLDADAVIELMREKASGELNIGTLNHILSITFTGRATVSFTNDDKPVEVVGVGFTYPNFSKYDIQKYQSKLEALLFTIMKNHIRASIIQDGMTPVVFNAPGAFLRTLSKTNQALVRRMINAALIKALNDHTTKKAFESGLLGQVILMGETSGVLMLLLVVLLLLVVVLLFVVQ